MTTIEQAKLLKDQAYSLHDCMFEYLEAMKPGSSTYKRLLAAHNRAHSRWMRREDKWRSLGGSYR